MTTTTDPNEDCMRRLLVGLLAGLATSLAVACGGDSTGRINVGGESHFLVHCNVDDTCAGGLACIGGVCTLDCGAGEEVCNELSPLASCAFQSSEPDARAVCDVGCGDDAACSALGAQHRCESGSCRASGVAPAGNSALEIGPLLPPGGESTELPAVDLGEGEGSSPVRALCATKPVPASSDVPADGEWRAATQADIDALEGCEELPFDVLIGTNSELTLDLRPLHALRVVTGRFVIVGVPSLEGLQGVRRVGGLTLERVGVSSLLSLASLESVGSALDDDRSGLHIRYCERLEDLAGLGSLVDTQYLFISGNTNLRSLDGLRLPVAMKGVVISDTPALVGLGSLSSLESVGKLELYGNQALERFELNALRNVTGSDLDVAETGIFIALNPRLQGVALSALEEASSVNIQRNERLLSVELGALSEISRLVIGLNLALPAGALVPYQSLPADLMRIGGNGPGTAVVGPSSVSGTMLDPCPWANDGHCDFCRALLLPTGGTLGAMCREELCATDDSDCLCGGLVPC